MKSTKFTIFALFAALMMMGCEAGLNFTGNEGVTVVSDKGSLSLAQLSVECRIDEQEPATGVEPKAATRSSVDVNNFDCSIINEEGKVVKSFKYGERPTEAIELKTGDYIFKVQSGEVPG